MAISPFAKRALQNISDSGFIRAKKLADLAIKTNTDDSGKITSRGYEQAIQILQPYVGSGKENESIDAQRLIASYGNSLDKISSKERNQNETVAAFKLQELDAYFTSFDGDVGGFRDPSSLVDTTSDALDNLSLGVINAIDQKEANGDSTDALYSYLNDITKRANTMRDLRNKFQSGELADGQSLDGFGYYVDTNPLDGSIRGAALLPAGIAPEGLASGYKRIDASAKIGGALLPVYAPVQQNAIGEYTAKIGDATWTGSGTGALRSDNEGNSKFLFKEGEFNISDKNAFPVKQSSVDKGSFGKGFIGRDESGNPVEAIFYRGMDGKLYSVDQATVERFKNDPVLSQKLNGYVAQFSPTDVRSIAKEAIPLPEDRITSESRFSTIQNEYEKAKAESDRYENMGFFGKLKEGFSILAEQGRQRQEAQRSTFFENKNAPNKPDEPRIGESMPDLVETGKEYFRKATSFFTGR